MAAEACSEGTGIQSDHMKATTTFIYSCCGIKKQLHHYAEHIISSLLVSPLISGSILISILTVTLQQYILEAPRDSEAALRQQWLAYTDNSTITSNVAGRNKCGLLNMFGNKQM